MNNKHPLLFFSFILLACTAFAQSKEVEQLKKSAKENDAKINTLQKESEEQRAVADAAVREATRLRQILWAREVAKASSEVVDKELAALLAVQSNTFNRKAGGYPYDDQVFRGLENALKLNNALPSELKDPTQPSLSLIGIRNGTLYTIGKTGEVTRWTQSNDDWMSEQVLVVHMDPPITTIEVSPDARTVVTGRPAKTTGNSQTEVYLLGSTEKEPSIISGFKGTITKLIFTADGSGFYALHNSGRSIGYSNLTTTKEIASTSDALSTMALSADGMLLAGAGRKTISFWNTKDLTSTSVTLAEGDAQVTVATYLPDQARLVVGDAQGRWSVVDSRSTEPGMRTRKSFTSQGAAIQQISFCSGKPLMATASPNGTIKIWNINQLNQSPITIEHVTSGGSLSFSPDGNQLLFTGTGGNAIYRRYLNVDAMAEQLCSKLNRNLTKDEWEGFFMGLPYEATCKK